MAKVLVLCYSSYGHIETMAYARAEGTRARRPGSQPVQDQRRPQRSAARPVARHGAQGGRRAGRPLPPRRAIGDAVGPNIPSNKGEQGPISVLERRRDGRVGRSPINRMPNNVRPRVRPKFARKSDA
jgi:hypothetical protein